MLSVALINTICVPDNATPTGSSACVDFRTLFGYSLQDLITKLLTVDPEARITAGEACEHPWLSTARPQLSSNNLSAGLEALKIFNAVRRLRAAVKSVSKYHVCARRTGVNCRGLAVAYPASRPAAVDGGWGWVTRQNGTTCAILSGELV